MNKNKLFVLNLWFWFAALPIIVWVNFSINSGKTFSLSSFGQLFGILAFSFYALTTLLSTRLKTFDKYFAGLNNLYKFHIFTGQLALIFTLMHPLFLLETYASSLAEALDFLWFPLVPEGALFGFLALLLAVIIVFVSLYVKLPYHIWRYTHKFTGLVLALAFWHIIETPSALMDQSIVLQILLYIYAAIAFVSYFYQAVYKDYFKRPNSTLLDVKRVANNIVRLKVTKPKDFNNKAGQFAFISLSLPGFKETHPFSVSSGESDNYLEFTVKALGDYTKKLYEKLPDIFKLQKNIKLKIEGPYGVFNYKLGKDKQIWIAGGIGITPFLSMTKTLTNTNNKNINLFYCVKNENELIDKDVLDKKSKEISNFNVFYHFSDKDGFINAKSILEKANIDSNNTQGVSVFLCAPPSMIKSLKQQFKKLGFKDFQLISEEFNF